MQGREAAIAHGQRHPLQREGFSRPPPRELSRELHPRDCANGLRPSPSGGMDSPLAEPGNSRDKPSRRGGGRVEEPISVLAAARERGCEGEKSPLQQREGKKGAWDTTGVGKGKGRLPAVIRRSAGHVPLPPLSSTEKAAPPPRPPYIPAPRPELVPADGYIPPTPSPAHKTTLLSLRSPPSPMFPVCTVPRSRGAVSSGGLINLVRLEAGEDGTTFSPPPPPYTRGRAEGYCSSWSVRLSVSQRPQAPPPAPRAGFPGGPC